MPLLTDDYDGDHRSEIAAVSPLGLAILKQSGSSLVSSMTAPNGTRFGGGWLLNTADNHVHFSADLDGNGCAELFIGSPWGIGALSQAGGSMNSILMAPNGTRFGGWLLNTADNWFGPVGDFDGDGIPEMFISSPWGIGVMKFSQGTFNVLMMAPNGARFGGWLLNTADNRFGPVGDFDGDGRIEILISSPWGIGILKLAGSTFAVPFMAPNGTRFGGWLLNTGDNTFSAAGDFDGDRRSELLVVSPWGMGLLKQNGATLLAPFMVPNGTHLGSWVLNTNGDQIGPVADYHGDGHDALLVSAPAGIAVLRSDGTTMMSSVMCANGTRAGEWIVNTLENRIELTGDYDGDGRAEIIVSGDSRLVVLDIVDSAFTTGAVMNWRASAVSALIPNAV